MIAGAMEWVRRNGRGRRWRTLRTWRGPWEREIPSAAVVCGCACLPHKSGASGGGISARSRQEGGSREGGGDRMCYRDRFESRSPCWCVCACSLERRWAGADLRARRVWGRRWGTVVQCCPSVQVLSSADSGGGVALTPRRKVRAEHSTAGPACAAKRRVPCVTLENLRPRKIAINPQQRISSNQQHCDSTL